MDLATRLELLLEVSEHGSFAKAADARGLDRSVLSKQIKKLEDSLGLRLLNRSTRALSLTNAGVEIVKQAQKVRELLDDTRHLADTFHDEPKGRLRISTSTMFGRKYLQKATETFLEKYPLVSIETNLDDRKVDIISDRFDVVFRIGRPQDSNLIAKVLADNRLVLLASETFLEKHGYPQTLEELAELPAISYANEAFSSNKIQLAHNTDQSKNFSFVAKSRYTVNEVELVMESLVAGLGYAIVSQFMLMDTTEKLGLVELFPDYHIPYEGCLYALYSHRNQPPLVKSFIETVQETIGTPPIWESYLP